MGGEWRVSEDNLKNDEGRKVRRSKEKKNGKKVKWRNGGWNEWCGGKRFENRKKKIVSWLFIDSILLDPFQRPPPTPRLSLSSFSFPTSFFSKTYFEFRTLSPILLFICPSFPTTLSLSPSPSPSPSPYPPTSQSLLVSVKMAWVTPPSFFSMEMYETTVSYIRSQLPTSFHHPKLAIVCGSGLGGLVDTLKGPIFELEYKVKEKKKT